MYEFEMVRFTLERSDIIIDDYLADDHKMLVT